MWIKNNSKLEWLNYSLGKKTIDIKAESVFEIEDDLGRKLLSLLGCDKWLTRTEKPVEKKKVVKKKTFVTTDSVVTKKVKKSKKVNKK